MGGASFSDDEWLAALLGEWRLEREIFDAAGGRGRVRGALSVAPLADGAWARERGRLVWDGGVFDASSAKYWRVEAAALRVFDDPDGRERWRFDLTRAAATGDAATRFKCGDDLYRGALAIGRDRFEVVWRVEGPRKRYRSVSRFWRPDLRAGATPG